MTIDQEIDALKGMEAAMRAIESAIDERDRLRRELASLDERIRRLLDERDTVRSKLQALQTTMMLIRDGGTGPLSLETRKEMNEALVKSMDGTT